jgi:hypothetical protein
MFCFVITVRHSLSLTVLVWCFGEAILSTTLLFQRARTNDRGWMEFNNSANLGIRISKGTLERMKETVTTIHLFDILLGALTYSVLLFFTVFCWFLASS